MSQKNTKVFNVGIIGCGRVAGHHARSIAKVEGMRLVAVCDLELEKAHELANAHDAAAFTNYHQMLKSHPEIDVVAVITPSGMHYEHAIDIVKYHKRHVVIEKPVVMRLSEGHDLKMAAKANGVEVFPVYQYRFNKAVQRVRTAVQTQEIGTLVLATVRTRWCRPQSYYDRAPWRGTFALDGGATTNQGIHHLDLLRYLAGEVVSVNAHMKTFGANIEVEDTVVATIEFSSGALGVLEVTTAARPDDLESSISILGSKGMAMVGGWATNELVTFTPDRSQENLCTEEFPDVYGFGHTEIYRGIQRALADMGPPAVEFDDGIKSLELLHSLYLSDECRTAVSVAEGRESARLGRPNPELARLYQTPKPE